ncbi:MAG: hypothetical protein ABJE47_14335 [bacterium]
MSVAYIFDAEGPFAIRDTELVQRALAARGLRRFDVAVPLEADVTCRIPVYAETHPREELIDRLAATIATDDQAMLEIRRGLS